MREAGGRLGFSPSAVVLHHRRSSLRAYWRQQRGYGRAEALLERKWPHMYNRAGHISWRGRMYGSGTTCSRGRRQRIYHGTWGTAPFQSLYEREPGAIGSLAAMPEWYLVIALLAMFSALGLLWRPVLVALPLLATAAAASIARALWAACSAHWPEPSAPRRTRWRQGGLLLLMFLAQPLARLIGRLGYGLTPWRVFGGSRMALPVARSCAVWSETWRSQDERTAELESVIRADGVTVLRGGDFDRWDLTVRGGLALVRLRMAIEEHGTGRQMVRARVSPVPSLFGVTVTLATGALALLAAIDGASIVAVGFSGSALLLIGAAIREAAAATGHVLSAIELHDARDRVTVHSATAAVEEAVAG
jgi:hypothetical protein